MVKLLAVLLAVLTSTAHAQIPRERLFRNDDSKRLSRLGQSSAGGGGGATCSTCTTGLVAYWKFDNSLTDATGNGYNAVNPITYTTGVINQAVLSDGVSTLATAAIPLSVSAAGAFSISTWVKNTGTITPGDLGAIFVNSTDFYGLFLSKAAHKLCFYNGAYNYSTGIWADNVRAHIVATYDGGSPAALRFYINGTLTDTITVSISHWAPNIMFNANASAAMPGNIDEQGVWSRALNQSEVTSLYNSGAALAYPFQ